MTTRRLSDEAEAQLGETLRQAYDYWRSCWPAPTRLPGRQHLDPIEVPKLLPNLWLLDVEGPPRRYRYRLVGTAVVTAMRGDCTGLSLDELLEGEVLAETLRVMDRIVETGNPDWRRGLPLVHADRRFDQMERLLLPLASDGESIDMLLGCSQYHSRLAPATTANQCRPEHAPL